MGGNSQHVGKQKLSSGRDVHKWLNSAEDKLVETLVKNSDSEETGIIGKNALKQKRVVKMKPSSIYWNGLRTFEIVLKAGVSLTAACNISYSLYKKNAELEVKSDGETFDDSTAGRGDTVLFSPISPDYDFEKSATITLTKKESEFLSDKISKAILTKDSLLAFLIKNKLRCNSFDEIPVNILPAQIQHDYLMARTFSDFIIGAHIRYNVIFSEYKDEEMINEFKQWRNEFVNRQFDLDMILGRITCNYEVQKFCRDFLDCTYKNDMQTMDELIVAREKSVKGDRAKLRKPKEYRYNYDSPVHFYRLDFRFGTAKTIIGDIIKGLEE